MSETANERYERLTEEFYRETGMMAPGKDVPAAMGSSDDRTRFNAWYEWLSRRPAVPSAPTTNPEEGPA